MSKKLPGEDLPTLLPIKRAAQLLAVSPQTIYKYIRERRIKAKNLTGRPREKGKRTWRIPLTEVERVIGLRICPKTWRAISSPAICAHCRRDCPRSGHTEGWADEAEK